MSTTLKNANQSILKNFLWFSAERHRLFVRRQQGLPQEDWTSDSVLMRHRFCNSYRVLDRGSQFFIREMLGDNPDRETTLARAAMYRMTNEPKFWKFYIEQQGHAPSLDELADGTLLRLMNEAHKKNIQIFRGSYIISFGAESRGQLKHQFAPEIFYRNFHPQGDSYVGTKFFQANSAYGRLVALEGVYRIGPFLAQQINTDVNYSAHHLDSENFRVVGGPGSRRGLQYIFGADAVPADYHNVKFQLLITELRSVLSVQELELPDGSTRGLSLMDVQNCLCEFGKYVKLASKYSEDPLGRVMGKKPFQGMANGKPLDIVLPAHWANESLIS